jgi:hypothetical protein
LATVKKIFSSETAWQNGAKLGPYLLAKQNETKKVYRGPYIDASCQVWLHFAKQFQRRLMLNKSSPLKLLSQMKPNLAGSIYVRYSIKLKQELLLAAIFVGQTERNEET